MNDDTRREMACQELVEVITGYLDSLLSAFRRWRDSQTVL